jgi:hypothetical protein
MHPRSGFVKFTFGKPELAIALHRGMRPTLGATAQAGAETSMVAAIVHLHSSNPIDGCPGQTPAAFASLSWEYEGPVECDRESENGRRFAVCVHYRPRHPLEPFGDQRFTGSTGGWIGHRDHNPQSLGQPPPWRRSLFASVRRASQSRWNDDQPRKSAAMTDEYRFGQSHQFRV